MSGIDPTADLGCRPFGQRQGAGRVLLIRTAFLFLGCLLSAGSTAAERLRGDNSGQLPLNQRVLIVYNTANSDSVSVANYYATRRNIPPANLCPITPPSTTLLTWTQYVSSVKTPVQDCLTSVGPGNILYIVLIYQTPYMVKAASGTGYYALDQYVGDIWDQYANEDFYPYPSRLQPYYEDAQSEGNVYQNFVSFADYRAQNGALLIYSVWRLDGASAALAEGLVDKAITAESSGLLGQACLDREHGPISGVNDSDYGEGEWDLHQAAAFARLVGFTVIEDGHPQEFGTPPAPDCPNAAMYSGWYSLNHYNDAFTWNTGAIGFHLDSASAVNPRGGTNWSANAIIKGITVTSGSVAEPYLQGLARPGGTFRDLYQGANVGDAFLRNTRWLKWMILYLGDPLYLPFPNGLPPLNPPPPQYSLGLSPRYIVNGATSTGIVTLATPAPAGGTLVNLTSSNTALIQVPASVTVLQGQRSATFTATAAASPLVTADTPARITAADVGQNSLTVSPWLGGLFVTPGWILSKAQATGLVVLNADTPVGGTVVSLKTDNMAVNVPSKVSVPQGQSQINFTIKSSSVSSITTVTITASLNGARAKTTLTLKPALQNLTLFPTTVPGRAKETASITLGLVAPSNWPVGMSSSNTAVASVPSLVTVPAGSQGLVVPVTTVPQCTSAAVTITATSGLSTKSASLTVTPPPVANLSFSSTVKGGNNLMAAVSVSYAACSAGLPVTLMSSNPSVASVPANITVSGGQISGTFTIMTAKVITSTVVTISATSDNVTKTKTLTVTP